MTTARGSYIFGSLGMTAIPASHKVFIVQLKIKLNTKFSLLLRGSNFYESYEILFVWCPSNLLWLLFHFDNGYLNANSRLIRLNTKFKLKITMSWTVHFWPYHTLVKIHSPEQNGSKVTVQDNIIEQNQDHMNSVWE